MKEINPLSLIADTDAELSVVTIKSRLMIEITKFIRSNSMTQKDAAKAIGVSQPRVSAMMNGAISKFSLDFLVKAAVALGCPISIRFNGVEMVEVGCAKEVDD